MLGARHLCKLGAFEDQLAGIYQTTCLIEVNVSYLSLGCFISTRIAMLCFYSLDIDSA